MTTSIRPPFSGAMRRDLDALPSWAVLQKAAYPIAFLGDSPWKLVVKDDDEWFLDSSVTPFVDTTTGVPDGAELWRRLWRGDLTVLPDLVGPNPWRYLRDPLVWEAILALRNRAMAPGPSLAKKVAAGATLGRQAALTLLTRTLEPLTRVGPQAVRSVDVTRVYRGLVEAARATGRDGEPRDVLVWESELGEQELSLGDRQRIWADVQRGAHLPAGGLPPHLRLRFSWRPVGSGGETEDPGDRIFEMQRRLYHVIRTWVVMTKATAKTLSVTVKKPGQARPVRTQTPATWAIATTAQFFGKSEHYIRDLLKNAPR